MKKTVLTVAVVAVVLVVVVGIVVWRSANRTTSDEIVIAAVAPQTGKYSEMGNDLLAAVRMAVDERNAAGGIGSRKIRLVVEDDGASPKDAVTVAQKIVGNSQVLGVVGHMNSGTTLPASQIYADAGLALVMPVPTNPKITQQGFRNLFRIPITDDLQGPACMRFLLDNLKKTQIAIVHNKQAYGEGIASEAKKYLESRGLSPLNFDGFNADEQDFRPLIGKVLRLQPEALFLGGDYAEAALFIRQARDQGLTVPIMMGDGCFDSQLMKIAGTATEGCYVSNIAPLTAPSPAADKFYKEFTAQNGKIVAFAPLGYEATCVLLDAIEKAQEKSRNGVLAALQNPNYSFDGILGKCSFAPNGDSRDRQVFMHAIKGDHFETVRQ
ncbi:MAG: branched-chain amino acid ABC transporter substrate-binding protein [Candidatus Brocadiia bacterium]